MAVNKEVPRRQVILPTNQKTDWLNARVLVADKGGLPPHVLHDEILIKLWATLPETEKAKLRAYYPAWARELHANPGKDGSFQKGQDLFDQADRTVVPWGEIVRLGMTDAIIGPRVSLVIDPGIKPEGVQIEKYKGIDNVAVIHPESIAIITPDIRISGNRGQVDERTGVPREVTQETLEGLTFEQIRILFAKMDILSVRPLVRSDGSFNTYDRQDVVAYFRRVVAFGAAYVGLSEQSEAINSSRQFDSIFTEMAETQRRSVTGPMFK